MRRFTTKQNGNSLPNLSGSLRREGLRVEISRVADGIYPVGQRPRRLIRGTMPGYSGSRRSGPNFCKDGTNHF